MPDTTVKLEQLMPLIRERLAAGESVRFTPRGISMRPMLEGGRDQVILSPLPQKLKKYDLPLYQRDDGHYILHRIVKVGAEYTCIGDHQLIYESGIRPDQMIALATGFVRKGRTWSVHSPAYRFYCRFWHYTRPVRRMYVRCRGLVRAVISHLK